MRVELLNREIFYSLWEAKIVIESWRHHDDTKRHPASLGYRPPAPEVFAPTMAAWPSEPVAVVQRPTLDQRSHQAPNGGRSDSVRSRTFGPSAAPPGLNSITRPAFRPEYLNALC